MDDDYKSWKNVNSGKGLLIDYKADGWNGEKNERAYLNRAWCRVEMLYASAIPLCVHQNKESRLEKITCGLEFAQRNNRRPHFIFGTKESKSGAHALVLPPLLNSNLLQFSPDMGYLSYESDRPKIASLMRELNEVYPQKPVQYGYSGTLNEKGQRSGYATFIFEDGEKYEGQWENDLPHGLGRYDHVSGYYYKGEFARGKRHGLGAYFMAYGGKLEGTFSNDVPEGVCILTTSMGPYLINMVYIILSLSRWSKTQL